MDPITGLSDSKLGLANAASSNVLSGKTFYAGDKTLKTGSMVNRGAWTSSIAAGSSVTIPAGYHNGTGKVTSIDGDRTVSLLVNSTGKIASGPWSLSYSKGFSGYSAFVISVVARNLDPLYSTTVTASSGTVSSTYLQAIAMEDDRTYLHAKLFSISNANKGSTTISINSGNSYGSGWGYIIYGID